MGRIVRRTMSVLAEDRPDVIISVIPFVNGALLAAGEGTPVLVVPVDLDPRLYLTDLDGHGPTPALHYAVPFDDPEIRRLLEKAGISAGASPVTGFPVGPEFHVPRDRDALRAALGLPLDRPVCLLSMGSLGSPALLQYASAIAHVPRPLHVVACAGRNAALRAQLSRRSHRPGSNPVSVLPFTDRMADWIAASDVVVTKPGPATLCEALYSGTPVLVDRTGPVLAWEELNIGFVQRVGFGRIVTDLAQLPRLLGEGVFDAGRRAALQRNARRFERVDFGRAVADLVASLPGRKRAPASRVEPHG